MVCLPTNRRDKKDAQRSFQEYTFKTYALVAAQQKTLYGTLLIGTAIKWVYIYNQYNITVIMMQCSKLSFYYVHLPGAKTAKTMQPAICLCA